MNNYFNTLGIDIIDDDNIIRNAYAQSLRQYSPEKNPDKFNEIRKAFDIIGDAKKRKIYINELNAGNTLLEIIGKFYEEVENGDVEKAKKLYIKAENIDENNEMVEKAYPKLLELDGKYDKALKIYINLRSKYPEEAEHFNTRRIICLIEINKIEVAKIAIIGQLKNRDIINVAFANFNYKNINTENSKLNIELIEEMEKLLKDSENYDHLSLVYWFKVYNILLEDTDKYDLHKEVEKLCQYTKYSDVNFEFVKDELIDLVNSLDKYYRVRESSILLYYMEKYLKLKTSEEALVNFKLIENACIELKRAQDDASVENVIIGFTYKELYSKSLKEAGEYDKFEEDNNNNIDYYLTNSPDVIISTVQYIKRTYNSVYTFNKVFYDELEKIAKENLNIINGNSANNNNNTYENKSRTTTDPTSNTKNSSKGGWGCLIYIIIWGIASRFITPIGAFILVFVLMGKYGIK